MELLQRFPGKGRIWGRAGPTPREGCLWLGSRGRGRDYTSRDTGRTAKQDGSGGEVASTQRNSSPDQEATEPEVAKSKPEVHRKEPAASGAPSGGASHGGTGEGKPGVRGRGVGRVWELVGLSCF